MVSSNTETKILALDFLNREKIVAMVLTPVCDHRVDARCREDIATKLLRAQNATDKTYNEKGYVKGKKENPPKFFSHRHRLRLRKSQRSEHLGAAGWSHIGPGWLLTCQL